MTLGTLLPAMAQQKVLSLKECLETGLEQNYDIRIVRNDERISSNNATVANVRTSTFIHIGRIKSITTSRAVESFKRDKIYAAG